MEDDFVGFAQVGTPRRRRGRVAAAIAQKNSTPEETRIMCALILLHRGMSPARVAIQPQVNLQIEKVKRMAAALNSVSMIAMTSNE
jgi:hypothetical protein